MAIILYSIVCIHLWFISFISFHFDSLWFTLSSSLSSYFISGNNEMCSNDLVSHKSNLFAFHAIFPILVSFSFSLFFWLTMSFSFVVPFCFRFAFIFLSFVPYFALRPWACVCVCVGVLGSSDHATFSIQHRQCCGFASFLSCVWWFLSELFPSDKTATANRMQRMKIIKWRTRNLQKIKWNETNRTRLEQRESDWRLWHYVVHSCHVTDKYKYFFSSFFLSITIVSLS